MCCLEIALDFTYSTCIMRVLILFAHPALEKSRINRQLIDKALNFPNITVHDLYETYPDFDIDVDYEQKLAEAHDVILLQHPFYWYSTPALVKQWLDLVLEHGWAYGSAGDALKGKYFLNVVTCGGTKNVYRSEGFNRFSVRDFLRPLEQTARLCKMTFLPPFITYGSHRLDAEDIRKAADDYGRVLEGLQNDSINLELAQDFDELNKAVEVICHVSLGGIANGR